MTNVTLRMLIRFAYRVSDPQISDGPKWIDTTRFDIVAKADGPAERTDLLDMLQPLLADRFQLRFHHETRTLAGYAITVAKGGMVAKPGDANHCGTNTNPGYINAKSCTMAELTTRLASILQRPVADRTNDSRRYDFVLRWTPDNMQAGGAADGISLFAALQEQVGVKLESQKVPVDVLVIDRAELPSEN
ncbi:MAG TPA: TIGR03435 family protein, partial [Bryobacteraceae bacterium]|nr:TIGR03435 family protein [Bryobacteraceae bacterium]